MEQKAEKLKQLQERNEKLWPVVSKSFEQHEELNRYYRENKNYYDEYAANEVEIERLRLELMTPEERKQEKELMKGMKLKREGKL